MEEKLKVAVKRSVHILCGEFSDISGENHEHLTTVCNKAAWPSAVGVPEHSDCKTEDHLGPAQTPA